MIALLAFLVVAAVGVFLIWPGRFGTELWWLGSGTRASRAGRIRLLIGDVFLVGGLVGTIVVQLVGMRWDVGLAVMVAVQLVSVLLVVHRTVRYWRSARDAPRPPADAT